MITVADLLELLKDWDPNSLIVGGMAGEDAFYNLSEVSEYQHEDLGIKITVFVFGADEEEEGEDEGI